MDHFWQSCCLIVSHLFLRFQGWSYTSRATGKIPDVQGYLVVHIINSDREYFFFLKSLTVLFKSLCTVVGWPLAYSLDYRIKACKCILCFPSGCEKGFKYWILNNVRKTSGLLIVVPFKNFCPRMLSAFVSVAHAGHVTREKLETGRDCGQ